jgi:hypothetical protein
LNNQVTVYGAYGHTGRFVVAELCKRGWKPVLSGRDSVKLKAMSDEYPALSTRVATVEDPLSLSAAVSDSCAVINCAGPFLDTAGPIIEAAILSGIHYLDVAAEQAAVLDVFERFGTDHRLNGIVIAPAMAFFGGLGDLMATVAVGEWEDAEEICIAVALDSWKPTRGTRLTGRRNHGPRLIFSKNRLERGDPPPGRKWNFPAPFGDQEVEPLSLSETIAISRHIRTPEIRMYLNLPPLSDLRDADTPAPRAADESGRSSQIFLMDVIARRGEQERRVIARGRDIYAITAPIVVEATTRIVMGSVKARGVVAAGEAFDARDFLNSLTPTHLALDSSGVFRDTAHPQSDD